MESAVSGEVGLGGRERGVREEVEEEQEVRTHGGEAMWKPRAGKRKVVRLGGGRWCDF